jgi:UDP-N-acetylglucosamine 2-epimerase
MKKIATIIGTRPQFIKAAAVSLEVRRNFNEVYIHTGQHYNYEISEFFFKKMNIPKPKYNLNVISGTHGQQTGKMIAEIESILLKIEPHYILVYSGTNSTMVMLRKLLRRKSQKMHSALKIIN